MVDTSAAVAETSVSVAIMAKEWPMTVALMAGTGAMRAAGQLFLPKWPKEEEAAWKARRDTATLFPAFRRTVYVMAGKPFARPLTPSEDMPEQVKGWLDDVDREGVNLHVFAGEMFVESLAHGIAGIYVDMPKRPDVGARPVTIADEKAAGLRPYLVRIKHNQILGWRSGKIGNKIGLTQLRYKDDTTRPAGDFGEMKVERVRVLYVGRWELWEKAERPDADGRQWSIVDSGVTGLDYIPFVPLYGNRKALMVGVSPLLDVAYLNVKHWQSQSDQDTILHMARVPILAATGGDAKNPITIGSSTAVNVPIGGKLEWVEHTGQSISAGQTSLDALEQQMIQAGAELLVKKPGTRTATESSGDIEANKSELQRLAEDLEDALDRAIQIMGDYGSVKNPGTVTVFKDFGAFSLGEASATLVLSAQQAGIIRKVTAVKELQRRGELSSDIDAQTEVDAAEEEGPALGTITEDDVKTDPPAQKPAPAGGA